MSLPTSIELLLESHGDLYHVTSMRAFWKIIFDDLFELSYGRGDSEVRHSRRGEGFFASFSRVPNNRYRSGTYVTIVLDWDKLRNNHRLGAVDYWGWGGETESEERLFSSKPAITGFKKFIKAAHIRYADNVNRSEYENLTFISAFPVYVYQDKTAYELLDTRKAKTPADFMKDVPETSESPPYAHRSERDLIRMDELLKFLEDGGKRRIEPWYNRLMYYHRDFVEQMGADVHNMRSRKGLIVRGFWERWEKLLSRYGATSIREFALVFIEEHKK